MHQNQDDEDPNNISNWVHKRFSHNCYLNQKLYERDKFNQVYEIGLTADQDSDESSIESTTEESYFTSSRTKVWSYIGQNGVRASHVIEENQDNASCGSGSDDENRFLNPQEWYKVSGLYDDIKNNYNKERHASTYVYSASNNLEKFKSKLKQQEMIKIRHLEAYFNDLDDYFSKPINTRYKGPIYADIDKWNGFSTNHTYCKRNITKEWVEWHKMASAGRYDDENINDLLYKIFTFTRFIFHHAQY